LFDLVDFRDLSKYGATNWFWEATPADGAIFDDEFIANPNVLFIFPGLYDICLTTGNIHGSGGKLCKKTYISVRDEVEMCQGITESTSPSGRLTDDGGIVGDYSANKKCEFVINTCGKIQLYFKDFVLADAQDFIEVYDGADSKGTLIGKYVGGLNAPIPGGAQGLVGNTGNMYISFTSGASGQAKGFEAYWVTIADTSIKTPVSDFTFPTPLYTNSAELFQSTSQGKNLAYAWDFDPPAKKAGLEGGKNEYDRYSWNPAGTYDVKLVTSNCV